MKKVEQLLTKAKQKMAQKPDCTQLECTQCKESFPDEGQLRLHYESEEHLVKVREKSESKTLGDLKTFAKLKFVSESPARLNEASMPTSNEVSEKLFVWHDCVDIVSNFHVFSCWEVLLTNFVPRLHFPMTAAPFLNPSSTYLKRKRLKLQLIPLSFRLK